MMSCSETIRKIRLNLDLERKEFAQLLKITVSAVSSWENGEKRPKLIHIKELVKMAKSLNLNLSVEDFIND
jgi:DNA-binding transcriptional regulator YiaG